MFGLNKYANKIFEIKWIFNPDKIEDLEKLLMVQFEDRNSHFVIDEIGYTYIDILNGLEKLDFVLSKNGSEIMIKII